ncbi:hypothetical protein KUCAC02_007449 [Chaenocephalus aceratus]|uniref:Uncharacterized protein n=1 Tax=Chaenocephalus aceratus TaxID=36190 RepID=A0ACB9X5I1_CHAAC|nr:hypothetical protein KUCAC02_007449 [Chaenocephalus aceratus]
MGIPSLSLFAPPTALTSAAGVRSCFARASFSAASIPLPVFVGPTWEQYPSCGFKNNPAFELRPGVCPALQPNHSSSSLPSPPK